MVALQGELDMATAEGLSDWLIDQSGSVVVVDLAELTFMDSSGISAFVMAQNQMGRQGNSMIFTRPTPMVRRTLELVGLEDWIQDWKPDWA
jgi:anti-sigma B factor antagonist